MVASKKKIHTYKNISLSTDHQHCSLFKDWIKNLTNCVPLQELLIDKRKNSFVGTRPISNVWFLIEINFVPMARGASSVNPTKGTLFPRPLFLTASSFVKF